MRKEIGNSQEIYVEMVNKMLQYEKREDVEHEKRTYSLKRH